VQKRLTVCLIGIKGLFILKNQVDRKVICCSCNYKSESNTKTKINNFILQITFQSTTFTVGMEGMLYNQMSKESVAGKLISIASDM
jgi:hypothetical protein